jgi:hypothetical protein
MLPFLFAYLSYTIAKHRCYNDDSCKYSYLNIPNEWVMGRDYSDTELEVRKRLPILFNESLIGVIDSVVPYSATTLMLRLQTSCPAL